MKFMLTFTIKPEAKGRDEAIARFKKTGGQPPAGVKLLGRWTAADFSGGYDLLDSNDPRARRQEPEHPPERGALRKAPPRAVPAVCFVDEVPVRDVQAAACERALLGVGHDLLEGVAGVAVLDVEVAVPFHDPDLRARGR